MARRSIPKSRLLDISGMDVVIAKMEKIIAATSGGQQGEKLKRVYFEAAAIHSRQVRVNIQALKIPGQLKEGLKASVVTNEGRESQSNAISRISQPAGVKRVGDAIDVWNPYWFEYGTVPRATTKGANRGRISDTKPGPFFRPAIQQTRQKVLETLVAGLKKLTGL